MTRPYVSPMCKRIFNHFHSFSHPGHKATAKLIGERFIWLNMSSDVKCCSVLSARKIRSSTTLSLSLYILLHLMAGSRTFILIWSVHYQTLKVISICWLLLIALCGDRWFHWKIHQQMSFLGQFSETGYLFLDAHLSLLLIVVFNFNLSSSRSS